MAGKDFPEVGESAEAAAPSLASKSGNRFCVRPSYPKIDSGRARRRSSMPLTGFLAIPTAAAGKSGRSAVGSREKITPEGWQRRTGLKLRFVYRRGRPSLLVVDDARINTRGFAARNRRKTGQASVIVFILVPQVALKKRLDVEGAAKRQAARVPSLIARHWPQS
jgi:Family of unknown function (DUF6441)